MCYPYDGIKSSIEYYNNYIDYLKQQIEQKDKEIEELKEQLLQYEESHQKKKVLK